MIQQPKESTRAAQIGEGISRLRGLAAIDANVLAALERLLRDGSVEQLENINSVLFAQQSGLDRSAVVSAMVAACKAGLLEFRWDLTCPACGFYAVRMPRLSEIDTRFYCSFCDITKTVVLDTLVSVNFRAVPALGTAETSPVAPRGRAERFERYRNPILQRCEETTQFLASVQRLTTVADVGETVHHDLATPPGDYWLALVSHDLGQQLVLGPQDAGIEVVVGTDEGRELSARPSATPGLTLHNRASREAALGVLYGVAQMRSSGCFPPANTYDRFLSGKELLCNQVFRDLYGGETLSAGIALQVENLSLLFTDLKGSTALYDAIGDVRAFSLVSEHFKILVGAIQRRSGSVVKTIGDAVMGAFPDPLPALDSALAMTRELQRFNATSGLPPLSLKIGLHTGPCIVVNSNDRLDYFGQTVNVAARVQGLADADEIVLTDTVLRAAGIPDLLRREKITPRSDLVSLKGVGEQVRVHTLRASPA